jgi:hypothetical protein
MADEGRQKAAAFDQMSKGWAIGSDSYKRALQKDFREKTIAKDWGGEEVVELNRLHWQDMLAEGAARIGQTLANIRTTRKSADWKIALASWMKTSSSVPNRWLSERLHMGAPDAVSRYVAEVALGKRASAEVLLKRLSTNSRG